MSSLVESYGLMAAGHEALRRGDAAAACDHFDRAARAAPTDVEAWLGLALASRELKDGAKAAAATDRALALAPRSFRALMVRADLYAEDGHARAASSFYAAALRNAPVGAQHTPQQMREMGRAHQMRDHYARAYETYLVETLKTGGFDPAHSSRRFADSIDLMMGRKKIFQQQPEQYYFPELPQIQFYDRAAFPWLSAVESATDDILAELQDVMKTGAAFQPYVETEADRPRPQDSRMTDNMDWSAFFLWKNGKAIAENAARCPKTMRALENIPQCMIPGRTPSILFSQLRPGAHIPPHNGYINARLICHLPLIVPDKCGFRVGNDTRAWKKGEAFVFDDTIEHEAWNNSGETRVVLLFEIWRPELDDEERGFVSNLIQAIDSHGSEHAAWTA